MRENVVVITGASAGIGAALAELLAKQGMSLVLVARRKDALESIAARCAGRAHAIVADVAQRAEVRRVVDGAIARFGRIDVWINNVGQGISRLPSQLTDEDVDEVMRLNVKSALYGMQEVLPHFKSRDAGHVISHLSCSVRAFEPGDVWTSRSMSRYSRQCRKLTDKKAATGIATMTPAAPPSVAPDQTVRITAGVDMCVPRLIKRG